LFKNWKEEFSQMADNSRHAGSRVRKADGINSHLKEKAQERRQNLAAQAAAPAASGSRRNDLLPHLKIEYVATERIRSADRRIRKKDMAQTARVRASISEFGVVHPLIVDEHFRLVHGHTIHEAAVELGLTELPVVALSHLSPPDLRRLSITLNRLGETGSWDEEVLQEEMQELVELNEDLVVTGFETAEIDALLCTETFDEADPLDDVPPLSPVAVSQPEDVWCLGPHRLLQGDARDDASYRAVFRDGELARLTLTDTPYNVANVGHVTSQAHHREFAMAAGEMTLEEFSRFIMAWLKASTAWVTEGGLIATFIDWRSVELVLANGRDLDLGLLNIVVWAKTNGGLGSLWRSQHELLPVFKKGKAPHVNNVALGKYGRWRSNVWNYPGASSLGSDAREGLSGHPTVKPRALLEDALLDISNRGDIVLDPFLGSGSTLIAAHATGRVCRGIEIDGPYCDLAIRRWETLSGEPARLEATGETHEQVAARRRSVQGEAS
jgi:DNA modification methylase